MIGCQVLLQFRRMLVLLVVRSRDREVSRVHEQVPFLGIVLVHLQITQRERSGLMDGVRHLLDGVFLRLGVVGVQRLFQLHIGVQRIVVRCGRLVAVRYVQRHLDLRFLREQTTAFQGCAYRDLVEVLHVPIQHVRFN